MFSFATLRYAATWCLALCLAMLTLTAHAKRLALVMGNDNYASVSKLQKAGNDAEAMARELKAAGFTVSLHKDLNYRGMVKAIESFSDGITGGDEVVVFYAGHGVQIKAGSYLLPVDIEADSESQVEKTAYGLNDLTEKLSEAKPAFTLVMVDACRDNPMKVKGRSVGNARGLNALEPPKGQVVVYSASRGQQALDRLSDNDSNPNGVFTREFITRMRTPGVKIEDLMRDVQDSVESLAKTVLHEQRPAVYNEARGNFYFYGPTKVQIQQGGDEAEAQTWAAAQAANSATAYQTYLDLFPKGRYVGPAKIKLDTIKQSPEKPVSDSEAGLWAEVKATGSREYLEAYIAQYPSGKYVVLARLELKKLDEADKVKNSKLAQETQQSRQREEQRVKAELVNKVEAVKKLDQERVADEAKREASTASNSNAELELKTKAFIKDIFSYFSDTNESAMNFLKQNMDDDVMFYGKLTKKEVILKEKTKFMVRWPVRKYAERPMSLKIKCEEMHKKCITEGIMDWDARNQNDNRVSIGAAKFFYEVQFINGIPKITAESSEVIERK